MATRLEERALRLFDYARDTGFTSSDKAKQVSKLLEEVGEFIEAIMNDDPRSALMEAGDVAWLLVDMLNVAGSEYLLAVGMASSLNKLEARHSKLVQELITRDGGGE